MRLYDGTGPAATEVRELLCRQSPRPVISAVNFAEATYILANDYGHDVALRRSRYLRRALRVEEIDTRAAQTAAWLKHAYRMSLGDTFAAATAIRHGCELWTGDAELL
ncbi:MAG: type II toxin-antitoxin system VapC family toxin [Acidimicrobiaceae bacterium]|nr:type II toxin-antitoxin system VapC family toxin [Acidimicrobiaceae bacterium]